MSVNSPNQHMKMDKCYLGVVDPPRNIYEYKINKELDLQNKHVEKFLNKKMSKKSQSDTVVNVLYGLVIAGVVALAGYTGYKKWDKICEFFKKFRKK